MTHSARRMRLGWLLALSFASAPAFAAGEDCKPGPDTKCTKHDATIFGDDPSYEDKPYSAEAQQAIYGGKHLNPTQRPGLEPTLSARSKLLGRHNL